MIQWKKALVNLLLIGKESGLSGNKVIAQLITKYEIRWYYSVCLSKRSLNSQEQLKMDNVYRPLKIILV